MAVQPQAAPETEFTFDPDTAKKRLNRMFGEQRTVLQTSDDGDVLHLHVNGDNGVTMHFIITPMRHLDRVDVFRNSDFGASVEHLHTTEYDTYDTVEGLLDILTGYAATTPDVTVTARVAAIDELDQPATDAGFPFNDFAATYRATK